MKKNMKKDILVMGFAMFAIFFGSGNLIFPPIIGLVSGEQVSWAIIGLALTGILFPMMALASVGNVGYNLQDMMKHINSWWHYLYMGLGLLVVIFGTLDVAVLLSSLVCKEFLVNCHLWRELFF